MGIRHVAGIQSRRLPIHPVKIRAQRHLVHERADSRREAHAFQPDCELLRSNERQQRPSASHREFSEPWLGTSAASVLVLGPRGIETYRGRDNRLPFDPTAIDVSVANSCDRRDVTVRISMRSAAPGAGSPKSDSEADRRLSHDAPSTAIARIADEIAAKIVGRETADRRSANWPSACRRTSPSMAKTPR